MPDEGTDPCSPLLTQKMNLSLGSHERTGTCSLGWGNKTGGNYSKGTHRIKIYYSDKGSTDRTLLGETTFKVVP